MKHTRIEDLSQEEKNQLLERMLREGRFAMGRPGFQALGPTASFARSVQPRTDTEKTLAHILKDHLEGQTVRVYRPLNDNFFTPEIKALITEHFSVDLPDSDLEEVPTLAALAALIEQETPKPDLPPIDTAKDDPPKLSPHQLRFWFFHQLEGPASAFNLLANVNMEGRLDATALNNSVKDIYACHEILRASFLEAEGHPFQSLETIPDTPLTFVDLGATKDPRTCAEKVIKTNATGAFCPSKGGLSRVLLIRLSPTTHILSLAQHHMVADKTSITLFLQQLSDQYKAYLTAKEPVPLKTPIQYHQFAQWQWHHAEQTWAPQRAYWEKQLAQNPGRHQLPLDRPRPSIQRFKGARQKLRISEKLTQALINLGATEGADLFTVLQTAFAAFIARYSQSKDITNGITTSYRERHPQLQSILGPCTNTLVMRTKTHDNPLFLNLLHRVRHSLMQARIHGEIPFERVVDLLSPERDLSQTPLFQVTFQLDEPSSPLRFPGLSTNFGIDNPHTTLFDLSLVLKLSSGRLAGYMEYNVDLFDGPTIIRWCRHFKTLLASLPQLAGKPISRLPLISGEEREKMLVDWNMTAINLGPRICVHDLIQKQVAHTPDAPAIVLTHSGQAFSYDRVNKMANRLAHRLIAKGIGPEHTVGLCCRRSMATVVGMLAILKAGAAFLPLDPDFPHDRLAFILKDASASGILVDSLLKDLFGNFSGTLILLDGLGNSPQAADIDDNPVGGVRDYHRATMFYTSGSQGFPKGVVTNHRALVNRLRWAQEVFPFNDQDRFLQLAAFHFDIAFWEITAPLLSGAQLVIPPPDAQSDVRELVGLVSTHHITALHFIPSLLHAFLQDTQVFTANKLRLVFCGGETLALATVMQFFEKLPARLVHFYGPTEAAINVTTASCRADWQAVTIGRPIANSAAYVLDPFLNPVPPCVPGELFIAGVALARGYEGQASQTAQSFIPNPFSGEHPFAAAGSRLYKTGDMASQAPSGTLYFLGRQDRQVKINGFRIEPREVEHTLARIDGVADNVVVCYTLGDEVHRLVGYVEPKKGFSLKKANLRTQLARHLPDYMIPAAFVVMDKIPYLPNGKINRQSLPGPEADWFAQGHTYVPPRTREELVLANVWADVLGLEQVGIHDNFFRLGGDSMMIVRMGARAAEVGLPLSTRQLFERPTIAQLVSSLGESEELELPENPIMHEAFDQQVMERSDALAAEDEEGASYTYLELALVANEMATRLVRFGISKGSRVAVCGRGTKALIGYLAVLKSGAACLPINPDWDEETRQSCCDLGEVDAVLLDNPTLLPEATVPLFLLSGKAKNHLKPPKVALSHRDLAVISYRKNAQGQHTLVAVDHGCLMRMLASLGSVPGLDAEDVFVLLEPRGLQWMLWPLIAGARLILPKPDTHLDPVRTNRILHDSEATTALVGDETLPSFLKVLRPGDSSLKLLLEGEVSVTEARTLLGRYRQMWHLYGWAETAYCCARGLIESRTLEDAQSHTQVGVNGPLHGTWLYVLDDHLDSVKPGTLGQLYVGGNVLSRCYLGDRRRTAANFIPDPFARHTSARLYRTNRRAYYLADGRIFFP